MRFDFETCSFLKVDEGLDRLALTASDRTLTWRELHREVLAISAELEGACPKDRPIMIYGHKEAGMVTTILACLMARVPYIPVDEVVPPARIAKGREIAAVEVAVDVGRRVIEGARNLRVPACEWSGESSAMPPFHGVDDLAYIIFTSGSTGEPKGVQINRKNVTDLARWVASEDFGFGPDDVVMNQCAFSFDVSFFDMMAGLQSGGHLILNSARELKAPAPYHALSGLPTVWSSTPSFLSLALTTPKFDQAHLPRLRRFYVAGEAVHGGLAQRLWRRFPDAELWNAYGPTEATVITTLTRVDREMITKYLSIPIGRSKPDVAMPTTAADGVSEGELLIVGDNVSPGYLNRPDLNESKFLLRDGRRAYRTGDLGYHEDGLIFYLGRIDSQIKLHGYRIELEEIDNQAASAGGVEVAATVGLKRGGEVKRLVCFLKAPGETPEITERVREHLAAKVPYYMVPAEFRVIEEMPYNANQKVDRNALVRLLEQG